MKLVSAFKISNRGLRTSILQVQLSDRNVGSNVISANITASTFLSSVCLTLCSLVGAWLTNASVNPMQGIVIYGNMSRSAEHIKLLCLLVCFVLAFCCFLESARQYARASFLVTTSGSRQEEIGYTKAVVIRGGEYWFVGLRALYFALNFLLWFFGPLPMFAGSIILVMTSYFHDAHHVQPPRRPSGPSTSIGVAK